MMDLKIMSLFVKDYTKTISIRQITKSLDINYSHTFKRIKILVDEKILFQQKQGSMNMISVNIMNLKAVQLLSFVEEQESQKFKKNILRLMIIEMVVIDPSATLGIFGSQVSGNATKNSDWDIFIITQQVKQMKKIMSRFPYETQIDLSVFSMEEFQESLKSPEETVVKHIIRNKQIIYNPHPFYNAIRILEKIKYAPN